MRSRENIRVSSDSLNNLIVAVSKGRYRVPQFQREFVWEKSKVLELFDSIYKEYPIGSFFLWKAEKKYNRLFRHSIELDIPPIRDDEDVSFILDGQQRITSLYVSLAGLTVRGTDYGWICFDAKERKFVHREPDNRRFVRVCDIWGEDAVEIGRGVDSAYTAAYDRCFRTLATYPVSLVEVCDKDLPDVCSIFQRINQAGKRLDRFDLISAMTFAQDFDLREKFKKDVIARLRRKSFGEISPAVVTQLMALLKKGACTERAEFSLTADEIKAVWEQVVASILLAADTLRENVGVKTADLLPYDALLTLVGYFYAKSGQRAPTEVQLRWIKKWFWRASFSQHYGSGGPTKMGRDKNLFDKLLVGEAPNFEPASNLTAETLIGTKMTWSRSAIRNAFLCLLAQRGPVHLLNNSALDLVSGGISDFTSPEKHHIFPQAFLRDHGADAEKVHALPNFCFLPAELNNRIRDAHPSEYFPELRTESPEFEDAAKRQLIPTDSDSGVGEDNYLQFLKKRSELIVQEIDRLTGLSSAPPEDQRQKVVHQLEVRLRDLIHSTLSEAFGAGYWETNVPSDVRIEAEKRIKSEVRRQPELSTERFAGPREKLNFCNVPDYVKLIQMRPNWPCFEPVFRRQADFQRHMEAFSDFRNLLMHGRAMTEIARRAGELAIVWLETVLSPEEVEADGGETEELDA